MKLLLTDFPDPILEILAHLKIRRKAEIRNKYPGFSGAAFWDIWRLITKSKTKNTTQSEVPEIVNSGNCIWKISCFLWGKEGLIPPFNKHVVIMQARERGC